MTELSEVQKKLETKDASQKMVASHIIKRCNADPTMIDAVMKPGHTMDGCWKYIQDHAKKQAVRGCAVIGDEQVYEWAEDYFRSATSSEKPTDKKTKENTKPVVDPLPETTAEPEEKAKDKTELHISSKNAAKKQQEVPKPKKKARKKADSDIEGQMSLFDFMGA